MVKRMGVRTVTTPEVQGDGSWVKVRAATIGEILDARREQETRDNAWFRMGRWLGRVFSWLLPNRPKSAPVSQITRDFTYRVIGYIADWNWVDGDGEPLPDPKENPSVVESLTDDEMSALIDAVYGGRRSEEQKN